MSVRLYMDVHVPFAMSTGLRLRGIDILTAPEDGAAKLKDAELLDRAAALGRVVFTRDKDFLREATSRQQAGLAFSGVIHAH